MRLMALLLLAALAGALVCAQDAASDPVEAAPAQEPTSAELERTTSAKTASLPEIDTAAQKTSEAAQWPAKVLSPRPGLNVLKAMIEKSLLLAEKAFEEAEKQVNERIQDGKQIAGNGADILQGLKKKFDPNNWFEKLKEWSPWP
ncbi:PREDICTED: extracellular glycoprotein lacritin isoform X1 [Hipposideros armiger]|uniref:Extracellular glycoprotein lacritin isoform X1 n=1 Tax=Hipposideros armiger TaxID=186990 RepID=A0A8B7SPA5_HIPAR|nr:PREDICTED: extracellular glycoprotein lacritin isoform X1 [Hipposideros armiger]